jgi:lipoprotein-releasing system permease protein
MYKLILCLRYLRTRYLAFVCIISVMLGVATLIVVNSVMNGFSTKLHDRLHDQHSDVAIDAVSMDGFDAPFARIQQIKDDPEIGAEIAAMSPALETFALMQYDRGLDGRRITRVVRLIGIDIATRGDVSGFNDYLRSPANKLKPRFNLEPDLLKAYHERERLLQQMHERDNPPIPPIPPPPGEVPHPVIPGLNDPVETQPPGVIIGYLIGHHRHRKQGELDAQDIPMLLRGDSLVLFTISGATLKPAYDRFVVTDYYKSDMSEYDANCVYVDLGHLQKLRNMEDRATSIQIKLKNPARADMVVDRLQRMFRSEPLIIETWEHKQGPLLRAIQIEKNLLNILLFLIIAVAGFGILAIFSMIVAEKTRDIGILKALGASNRGVMSIFLGYGLLLGVVGAALGSALGLSITHNINAIEHWIGQCTGQRIFTGEVYYFDKIPTRIDLHALAMVNLGTMAITVLFSILPAYRAARLQPVQALRYE